MKGFTPVTIRACLMLAILIFNCPEALRAQTTAGVTFLRMTMGSRAQAMGEAYTALARDVNGIYYNPGGLGYGHARELMLHHSEWIEDISVENVSFKYAFSRRMSIAAGVSYLHTPQLTRYEVDPVSGGPLEAGTFGVYDLVVTTGIGYRFSNYFSLGTNVKFFQEGLESVTGSGLAFDIGFISSLPDNSLSVGFAVQNLGPGVQYIERKETLPLTYRAGMAYRFPNNRGTVAVDMVKTIGEELYFTPGLEYELQDRLFLRGGYQLNNREGNGLTAGFGLNFVKQHTLNYVYVPYGDLGDTHRAELIFHLGEPAAPKSRYYSAADAGEANSRAKESINQAPGQSSSRAAANSAAAAEGLALQTAVGSSGNTLQPPTGVNLMKLDKNKSMLRWTPIRGENVKYNVYARQATGIDWIKTTPNPIAKTSQVFSPKKTGVKLLFVVTTVIGDKESDFSEPIFFETP